MVPIIEFSDMFCCEQLSPNESKQICDSKPYLEVRLDWVAAGLASRDSVGCAPSPRVLKSLDLSLLIVVCLELQNGQL